jgi:ferric-dicitrate binding protein FerR (iron transport regulator)
MDENNVERIYVLFARKLADEATPTELAELDDWLQQHPSLTSSLKNTTDQWNQETTFDHDFLEATYLLHLSRMKEKGYDISKPNSEDAVLNSFQKSSFKKQVFKKIIPLLFLAIVALGFLAWFSNRKKTTADNSVAEIKNEISTKKGSRTKIQLPDGSTVWLNADSKLNYDKSFNNKLREVHLTGEAFFDVVRNADKPFIIHTQSADIKVLGTQFNVKSYPGDKTTETSIIRGQVEITLTKHFNKKYLLKPNEKMVVLNEVELPHENKSKEKIPQANSIASLQNLTYKPGDSISVEAAWTVDKLSFEDESFEELSKKMERWYNVEISFKTPSLKHLHLTGSFKNENLQQALQALQYIEKFSYEINNNKVYIK